MDRNPIMAVLAVVGVLVSVLACSVSAMDYGWDHGWCAAKGGTVEIIGTCTLADGTLIKIPEE